MKLTMMKIQGSVTSIQTGCKVWIDNEEDTSSMMFFIKLTMVKIQGNGTSIQTGSKALVADSALKNAVALLPFRILLV